MVLDPRTPVIVGVGQINQHHESPEVEPVEALGQRPLRAAAASGDVLLGNVVVLADPEGAVAVVLQDLADGGAFRGQPASRARESV